MLHTTIRALEVIVRILYLCISSKSLTIYTERTMVLEYDELDNPDPKTAAVSVSVDARANPAFDFSKRIDASLGYEAWWDSEGVCTVETELRPFPLLEQDNLPSAPILAQYLPSSYYHSPGASYDWVNQHIIGETKGGVSN